MKNIYKILFLFVSFSFTIQAQKAVYTENFDSTNSWPQLNDKIKELKTFNGRYYFEHKQNEKFYSVTTRTFNLNTNNDFEIETSIQKISGVNNNGISFLYDYKDSKNYKEFGFSSNGYFRVAYAKNGTYYNNKKWTKDTAVKTGNYSNNKLKIKKTENTITYFLNGTNVFSQDFTAFVGNKIGFVLYKNQKISIDYIKVKETSNNTNYNENDSFTSNKTIIYDDFISNKNNWSTQNNDEVTLAVVNGYYEFNYKKNKGFTTTKTLTINTARDFKIEAKLQKISGIQKNGYGLTFARKDVKNQNQFIITPNGYFAIDIYNNGQFKSEVDWTLSSAIQKGNFAINTLRIEKKGDATEFYINNTKVHTAYNLTYYGNLYGFTVFDVQKIVVDKFTIAYTDQKTNTNNNNIIENSNILFEDNFTSNTNNWSYKNDTDAYFRINNGKYFIAHKKNTSGFNTTIAKPFDSSNNFEIEAKFDKTTGVTNYPYGILWGKGGSSEFGFYLASTGYYKIVRNVDGKEQVIVKWTTSSAINKNNGATNIIKIKREGNIYKYFVNEIYVTKTDFEPFFGDNLGFVVYNNQEVAVDYLKINKLEENRTNYVTKKTFALPFVESFSDNKNNWVLDDSEDYNSGITNGKLQITKKKKGGIFLSQQVDIDNNKDFIIETSMATLTNSNDGFYGLTFGRKNSSNEYSFMFSNGSYLFRKFENGQYNKIIPFTQSSAIKTNTNQYNKLKIVKSGNLLRFYINDQYVNEAPFYGLFGNYIGFSVYYDKHIAVDYLNVKYQNSNFNTPPVIAITSPNVALKRGFKIVEAKRILVTGTASDTDGIFEITVNGIEANVSENGNFTANVPLKYGKNDLIVKATDLKQASSTKTFTIKRKPANTDNNNTIITNNNNQNIDIGFGKYYALIIGVSEYEDETIPDLNGEPTKDAQALADVLVTNYTFDRNNVTILKNPTDSEIKRAFYNLRQKVTDKDNVLIFYAGHGEYDEVSEHGYWLPSNSVKAFEDNVILNTSIVSYIKAIRSKHTFLIADACFSGSIFKSRAITKEEKSAQRKYNLTSRKAITSGTLKTVPNKSVFIKYILKRLEDNTDKYLTSGKLFNRIEDPVINNSPNIPQRGVIHGTGDEGGDFIFIKR